VSQQIRGLEEQLGFALFERRGRRIVLNAAGEALLRSVEPALAQLDDGVQAAAAAASGSAQRLRVTTLPSFAQRWLLPRMGRWRERHPQMALEIDASQQVVDLLRDGFPRRHPAGPRAVGRARVRAAVRGADAFHRRRLATAARGCSARSRRRSRASRCSGDASMWQRWLRRAACTST
jgi:LysR family glycine cleavage system transcriptional activator